MIEKEIEQALARAVLCRTLQRGLARPGEAARRALLSDVACSARREAAVVLEGPEGASAEALAAMDRAGRVTLEELGRRHEAIFGHTLRGQVCPYETEHGAEALFQQGQELADIAGYYLAFGLRPPDDGAERVDHISCEMEFLQMLALKEAWALESRDDDMLEVTRQAWRGFMRDHIGRFGRAFGAALARADAGGMHGALGLLCQSFIEMECRRLGLPLGPDFLPLRPADDTVPMACGTGCGEEGLLEIASPTTSSGCAGEQG